MCSTRSTLNCQFPEPRSGFRVLRGLSPILSVSQEMSRRGVTRPGRGQQRVLGEVLTSVILDHIGSVGSNDVV
jgi:hypothetical protein